MNHKAKTIRSKAAQPVTLYWVSGRFSILVMTHNDVFIHPTLEVLFLIYLGELYMCVLSKCLLCLHFWRFFFYPRWGKELYDTFFFKSQKICLLTSPNNILGLRFYISKYFLLKGQCWAKLLACERKVQLDFRSTTEVSLAGAACGAWAWLD